MPIQRQHLTAIEGNTQRLDGGAMFGNAPKALWEKWLNPDPQNRIHLSCRALLLRLDDGRQVLFEAGIGAFFEPKLKERYGVVEDEHMLLKSLSAVGLRDQDIDIVILSHLHFDHAGGVLSAYHEGEPRLLFPKAKFYVGREHLQRAVKPHLRDRASFVPLINDKLQSSGRLCLVEGPTHPDLDFGVSFRFVHGHTIGLMLAELEVEGRPLVFASDLIPGTEWMHLPITMGYDRYPELLIDEKSALLHELEAKQGQLFFTHDPKASCAGIGRDTRNNFIPLVKIKFLISLLLLINTFVLADVHDKFLWLESEDDSKTRAWLAEEQSRSDLYFQHDERRSSLIAHLSALMEYDVVDVPQKIGDGFVFSGRLYGAQKLTLYKRDGSGEITPIMTPEGLSCLVGCVVHEEKSLVAYGLSEGGSDWQTWRIRNLNTGEDLPDHLDRIKFAQPAWDREGKGLFYFKFDEVASTADITNCQRLYYHRLGTPLADDEKLFETTRCDELFSTPYVSDDGRYLLFAKRNAQGQNSMICAELKNGEYAFQELIYSGSLECHYVGSVKDRLYFITQQDAPHGKIISLDPQVPDSIIDYIPESDAMMEQACFAGDKCVVSYLKDACSQIKIYDDQGRFHRQISLPAIGTTALSWKNMNLMGSPSSNEFFFPFTDFIRPTTIYQAHVETGHCEVFLGPHARWNADGYQSKQVFYPGKDGTLIPMFIVWKKNVNVTGRNPLLLYGYGGFNISLTPCFDARVLAWLDLGGVYAVANIRGGGEYGEEWHRAGMRGKKQTVFDDFIAAAEWLVANNYTTTSQMAINGRSNGGLLVGACLTQRPDLFKAAIVDVGVLDMLRFHRFTVGWCWMEEYGCPDDLNDANYLAAYSPYHQVKSGIAYPSTLMTTGDHDDRVVPYHSYKFTAALREAQEGENPVLLQVYQNTGHGFGKSTEQQVAEGVDFLYFLSNELGLRFVDVLGPAGRYYR